MSAVNDTHYQFIRCFKTQCTLSYQIVIVIMLFFKPVNVLGYGAAIFAENIEPAAFRTVPYIIVMLALKREKRDIIFH